MLVEIAASRCPPASGVLLTTRCASTTTTPAPVGLAGRPVRRAFAAVPRPWARKPRNPAAWKAQCRLGRPSTARGLGATNCRTERHVSERAHAQWCVRPLRSQAQRSHTHGHRLCSALHLRERSELAATCWLSWLRPAWLVSGPRSPRVHGSGIARPSFASRPRQVGRLKIVAKRAEPDRLGAVLALVAADLARTWTKQQRKQGPTLTAPVTHRGFQPTSERSRWKPWVRARRQGAAGARVQLSGHSYPTQRPPDRGPDRGQARAAHRSPVSD